jgi:CubicO group peptidase (beta-lactamase class C family)
MRLHTSPIRILCTVLSFLSIGRICGDEVRIEPAVAVGFDTVRNRGYQLQTSADLNRWLDLGNAVHGQSGAEGQLFAAKDADQFFRLESFDVRDLTSILAVIRSQKDLPALACAVVRSNRVVGFGVAGVRKQGVSEPVTLADKWHHGSLTKSMTATLAALLVDAGTLTWTTKVVDVFPEFAAGMHEDWKTVTLELLLAHRSGAPEDLNPSGIWTQIWNFGGTPREARLLLLQKVTALAPKSKPGTKYEYSNAGYAIAGAMLEKLANKPWEDLITERLFRPLGMTSAGFGVPATPRYIDQPWGHILGAGNARTPVAPGTDADNPPAIGPAGTVHCSLLDMARYVAFHLAGTRGEGTLLKPETFTKLYADVADQGYSLGWSVLTRPWAGGKALQHNGSNLQWFTTVWIAPNRNWAVVVLTNYGGTGAAAATDAVVARMIQEWGL